MDLSSSLKGIELGKLVLSSGLLHSTWSKISEIRASNYPNQDTALGIKIHEEAKYTLVVFAARRVSRNGSLDSEATLLPGSQNPNPFQFLCSDKISKFSVHATAFKLFCSAYNEDLSGLKTKLLDESAKPVIITGAGLGGSVASLFTLWLLETIDTKSKRPLCITFGSPLIGDASLQQILEDSVTNSCFLHVAQQKTRIETDFKPFGAFLICSDSECICIEDPEAVMELLTGANADLVDYGEVLQRLDPSVLSMADSRLMIDDLIEGMKKRAEKKEVRFDKSIKLKDIKIAMIYLEWYRKKSKKAMNGYYDEYRYEVPGAASINIQAYIKELNKYWISVVEDLEKKPRSDMNRRFKFSGQNYRRMIEPLNIAEYYRDGHKGYSAKGRHPHYVRLEKWFEDQTTEKSTRDETRVSSDRFTLDSCFWAEVEETLIVLNSLKAQEGMRDEVSMGKLVEFGKYMWALINKREVSPEIFLENSSFMRLWKAYKEIIEKDGSDSSPSNFTKFMNTGQYKTYG